jgi:hypothetical protein
LLLSGFENVSLYYVLLIIFAKMSKRAYFTFGFAGNTDISAMQNEPVMRFGNILLRNMRS